MPTVAELRKLCKKQKITGYSGKRKSWLLEHCGSKPAGRKSSGRKSSGRKSSGRKPAARKPAARKPVARKPAARKSSGRKSSGKLMKVVKSKAGVVYKRPSARKMYDAGRPIGTKVSYNGKTKCLKLRGDGTPFLGKC